MFFLIIMPFAFSVAPQMPEGVKYSFEDSTGVTFRFSELRLWEENTPSREQMLGHGDTEGEIVHIFLYALQVKYVMNDPDNGLPVNYTTLMDNYGCIVNRHDTLTVYTGALGQGSHPVDKDARKATNDGPLQKFLTAEQILELLVKP